MTCHFTLDVLYMSMEWQRRGQCFLKKQNFGRNVGSSVSVARQRDSCGGVEWLRRCGASEMLPCFSFLCSSFGDPVS